MTSLAAVVIGRNERPRLERALCSVLPECHPVVYVDSASTDGSPDTARALGAAVVALDLSIPFTFGRARNAGAAHALGLAPGTAYVQFVDADSEIAASWLAQASAVLAHSPRVGAVHGRVRERRSRGDIYNRLYELEFDPVNEDPDVFGGMALLRVAAMQPLGGFDQTLVSFEDHDLSFRLRQAGWRIEQLAGDMAIHEGRMSRALDWWTRERRAGHARAQLIRKHGCGGSPTWRRAYASIWFWGALIPLLALGVAWISNPAAIVVLSAYVALLYRIFRRKHRCGFAAGDAALYAFGRVVGKFPQLHGVLTAMMRRPGSA